MNLDTIEIRIIPYEQGNEVFDFIVKYFYRDEPLASCEPKMIPGELDREHILQCIQAGTSIMAVQKCPNGEQIVGVNIGSIKTPASTQEYYDEAEKEGNTKYGKILKFLGDCSKKADLFNRYGVNKLFYSFLSCVHEDFRGHNLGMRLKTELMILARSLGYKLVSSDCTSFYSARVLQRMGWDYVDCIMYKDYVDENGEQIFAISAPHEGIKSYAVRL